MVYFDYFFFRCVEREGRHLYRCLPQLIIKTKSSTDTHTHICLAHLLQHGRFRKCGKRREALCTTHIDRTSSSTCVFLSHTELLLDNNKNVEEEEEEEEEEGEANGDGGWPGFADVGAAEDFDQ